MNLGSVRNNFFKIFTDVFPKNYVRLEEFYLVLFIYEFLSSRVPIPHLIQELPNV